MAAIRLCLTIVWHVIFFQVKPILHQNNLHLASFQMKAQLLQGILVDLKVVLQTLYTSTDAARLWFHNKDTVNQPKKRSGNFFSELNLF